MSVARMMLVRAKRDVRRLRMCAGLVAVAVAGLAPAARAGSYFIDDASVEASGAAFAGQSARAGDASALFYNPANIVGLPRIQIGLSSYGAWLHADLDDAGTDVRTPGSGGTPRPVQGGSGGNPLGSRFPVSFAAAAPLSNERAWVGIGASTPFATQVDFGRHWFGRYGASLTDMVVVDLSPTLGYEVSEKLSVAASLVARYARADFRSALPDPLDPQGPRLETDGAVSVKGDDWDLGYALGVRWEPTAGTRIGLAYRSGTKVDLDGRARFSGLQGPLAFRNGSVGASTEFGLPDLLFLGVAQEVTPKLTLLAQLNGYDWSDFKRVSIRLDDGTRIVSPQGYHDSWSASLGAEYRLRDAWTLRAGAQFDRTPVDDALRSPRTPDADRVRLSAGLSYAWSERMRLDLSYSHVFVRDSTIDRTDRVFAGTPVESTAVTRARAEASADVIGVGLVYTF